MTEPVPGTPRSSLLHISDLHFGTERPQVLEALVDMAHAGIPALRGIVFTGDVTQRARLREFDASRRFMQRLPAVPQIVIPGNHDIPLFNLPMRLLRPYARFDRAFGSHADAVWSDTDWLVVSLNTTRRWRHRHGELSQAQVRFTADALRRAQRRQLRLVLVHQPAALPESAERDASGNVPTRGDDRLRGTDAAARAWAEAGADAVLGGHIHLPYVTPLAASQEAGHGRQVWAVQAGTGISSRLRSDVGNSVNVLHHEAGPAGQDGPVLVVERWDYEDASFRPVASQRLVVSRP